MDRLGHIRETTEDLIEALQNNGSTESKIRDFLIDEIVELNSNLAEAEGKTRKEGFESGYKKAIEDVQSFLRTDQLTEPSKPA